MTPPWLLFTSSLRVESENNKYMENWSKDSSFLVIPVREIRQTENINIRKISGVLIGCLDSYYVCGNEWKTKVTIQPAFWVCLLFLESERNGINIYIPQMEKRKKKKTRNLECKYKNAVLLSHQLAKINMKQRKLIRREQESLHDT